MAFLLILFSFLFTLTTNHHLGRCTGSAYCTACKNCSACKYCNEQKGSCGVCSNIKKKNDGVNKEYKPYPLYKFSPGYKPPPLYKSEIYSDKNNPFVEKYKVEIKQTNYIKVLLGLDEEEITTYLDSLTKAAPLGAKIERTISNLGGLIIKITFNHKDEEQITCLSMTLGFERFEGTEMCFYQIVGGNTKYFIPNLNYVKDTFIEVSNNNWEKQFAKNKPLTISASLIFDSPTYCFLIFQFKEP